MIELLRRWAGLEQERCQYTVLSFKVRISNEWIELNYLMNAPRVVVDRDAYLQAAVQEALLGRTWHTEMMLYPDGSSGVVIHKDGTMRPVIGMSCTADSLAQGLLEAYLQALQS